MLVLDSPDSDFGGKWKVRQKLKHEISRIGNDLKTIVDVRESTNLSFHMSGMIADDRKNLGHVGKIETLSIFAIRPRPSQIIGDVCDLWFSLVGKIWDGRETAKSPIVWDFPDL